MQRLFEQCVKQYNVRWRFAAVRCFTAIRSRIAPGLLQQSAIGLLQGLQQSVRGLLQLTAIRYRIAPGLQQSAIGLPQQWLHAVSAADAEKFGVTPALVSRLYCFRRKSRGGRIRTSGAERNGFQVLCRYESKSGNDRIEWSQSCLLLAVGYVMVCRSQIRSRRREARGAAVLDLETCRAAGAVCKAANSQTPFLHGIEDLNLFARLRV